MNPYSGHLIDDILAVPEPEREKYKTLPQELQAEAERVLDGKRETFVPLDARGSKLAEWAKKERKRKAKRKMAKASRRANRE